MDAFGEERMGEARWYECRTALRYIPVVASIASFYIFWYYMEEPFALLFMEDFGVIVVGPFLVLGMWIQWFRLAFRYNVSIRIRAFLGLWALVTLLIALANFSDFFRQPWTYYVPAGGRTLKIFRTMW